MKKRLISMAAMLLLMLAIIPAAFADVTYPAPGDIPVGGTLDHLVAIVSASSAQATEGTLPPGILLETSSGSDGLYIYLRGTPSAVGSYDCVINVDGARTIICPVNVIPASPSVTAGPGVKCQPGGEAVVSVTASTTDGGSLSYQWYSNPNNNSSSGSLIPGATSSSYQAGTALAGTTYYYCVVTNTNKGQSVSVTSSAIPVTVEALSVSSISVQTMPAKIEYTVGDTLDSTGLLIYVNYSNGSSDVLSQGFDLYPTRLGRAGAQTIEVSYGGKTCTFSVNVEQAEEEIQGIGVLTLPDKTEYAPGETLDTTGLSIRVYTNNGHRDVYSGLACSPTSFDKPGSHTITVSYGGKTCTFAVSVVKEVSAVSLAVSKLPDKTVYTIGDTLDTAGLTLKLTDSSGKTQKISSEFRCTPTKLETAGRQEIVVSYGELECRFSVTVEETEAEASPQASAAPLPNLSPAPEEESSPAHKSSDGKVLVIIIIIAAVLALLGLGAYVYIMNREGADKLADKLEELISRFRRH